MNSVHAIVGPKRTASLCGPQFPLYDENKVPSCPATLGSHRANLANLTN